MRVEIWSDIACPWCYVGKRRFEQALRDFVHRDALTITWRSFELDPSAPASHDEPQTQLLARKYGVTVAEAEQMNARMSAAASGEGLAFQLDAVKVGNTFLAHRLLHFAGEHGLRDALGERLFAAYLGEGAALTDLDVLTALAVEVGLDADAVRDVLQGDQFADAVREDEATARAIGVSGVPFFVFDRRYGVSGAQPPAVLLEAMQKAWDEHAASA